VKALAAGCFAGAALLSSASASAQADKEALRREICVEAEARYVQVFGKASSLAEIPVVTMYKHTFCPTEIAVKAGATLRFVNVDRRTSHSVWFKAAGREESARLFGEEHVDMVMDLPPGTHDYLCGPHWQQEGMIGKVIVRP
jgi:plastocyanin